MRRQMLGDGGEFGPGRRRVGTGDGPARTGDGGPARARRLARASHILAVTFTNKAARAMRGPRLETLIGQPTGREGVSLGTFHALCARMLRREADRLGFSREFVIFDDADQLAVMRQTLKELKLDHKQMAPGRILALVSRAKNELIEPQDFAADSYIGEVAKRAYTRYQAALLQNNALDFDDLLQFPVRLLRDDEELRLAYRRRLPHILVDEEATVAKGVCSIFESQKPGVRQRMEGSIDAVIDRFENSPLSMRISYALLAYSLLQWIVFRFVILEGT